MILPRPKQSFDTNQEWSNHCLVYFNPKIRFYNIVVKQRQVSQNNKNQKQAISITPLHTTVSRTIADFFGFRMFTWIFANTEISGGVFNGRPALKGFLFCCVIVFMKFYTNINKDNLYICIT